MANDKALSEPVCLIDRRGKSAIRSQNWYNSAENALAEGDWVYGSLAYQWHW